MFHSTILNNFCGEDRIRTCEGLLPARFPSVCLRPLSHLSRYIIIIFQNTIKSNKIQLFRCGKTTSQITDIFQRAVLIYNSIIRCNALLSGNKRFALIVMRVFLSPNQKPKTFGIKNLFLAPIAESNLSMNHILLAKNNTDTKKRTKTGSLLYITLKTCSNYICYIAINISKIPSSYYRFSSQNYPYIRKKLVFFI